jgi:outer membrane protein assembly factor BamB
MWALDAATGAVRWFYRFTPELPDQGATCYGYPAVWHDLVIEPQLDGRIFALDKTSGEVRWSAPRVHELEHSLGDMRFASVGGNTLLVTNSALPPMIVAYDPATGTELWRNAHGGGSLFPAVLDSTTAYVDHGWIFASYELATGKLRWQTREGIGMPDPPIMGRPIIAGDRIYVAGRDGSYALKR